VAKANRPREALFTPVFLEDLRFWVDTDRKAALKVFDLIESVLREPFAGIGKPEPLKLLIPDIWLRRITQEQRLVYRVVGEWVDFLQARCHY